MNTRGQKTARKDADAAARRRERLARAVLTGGMVEIWRTFREERGRVRYADFIQEHGRGDVFGSGYSILEVLAYLRRGSETAERTLARICNTRAQAEKSARS